MVKAKVTVEDHIGWHLFTIDEKRCSIYYRGVIAKETDKTFLLQGVYAHYDKVLKTNSWLAVPAKVTPAKVLTAFEHVKNDHQKAVVERELELARAKGERFAAATEALNTFSPVRKDTEISGAAG